jgi:transcription initiation factor TFIIIB Brf1 subunit/transcription initiation factor TFIIB
MPEKEQKEVATKIQQGELNITKCKQVTKEEPIKEEPVKEELNKDEPIEEQKLTISDELPLVKIPDPKKEECFKIIPMDFTPQQYEDAVYTKRFYGALNAYLVYFEQRPEEVIRAYIRWTRKTSRWEAAKRYPNDLNILFDLVSEYYQNILEEERIDN